MMKKLSVIFAALLFSATCAFAQDISVQEGKKAKLEAEIKLLEKQLSDNNSKTRSTLDKITLVNRKVKARKELLSESTRELNRLNASISDGRKKVKALQARLDTMTLYYKRLVRNAYINRDSRVWYMYIMASDNIGQASRRYGYLRSLSTQMNIQAKKILGTKAEVEAQLEQLKTLQSKAAKVKKEHETGLASLQKEESELKSLSKTLEKQKSKYQKELASKKKQVEALNAEIQRMIADAMKEKKPKKPKGSSDTKLSAEFEANMGKLPWPVNGGSVVEQFGQHNHPVYKTIKMPFNNGINIAVGKNAQVRSVFNGIVKKIIVMPGYNKCVLVQHGNYFTFYCKLGSVNVKAGQKISTGDVIGTVDTIDGQSQLHFQLWKGTKPQNPETWLRL